MRLTLTVLAVLATACVPGRPPPATPVTLPLGVHARLLERRPGGSPCPARYPPGPRPPTPHVAAATDQETFARLWRWYGGKGGCPRVDFTREIVVAYDVWGSPCGHLTGFRLGPKGELTPTSKGPPECIAIAVTETWLAAIARDALPSEVWVGDGRLRVRVRP